MGDASNSLTWCNRALDLLCHMKSAISKTLEAWELFNAVDGDHTYFEDLYSVAPNVARIRVQFSIRETREHFDDMRRIAKELIYYEESCKRMLNIVGALV